MKSIWSFWSKPFKEKKSTAWASQKYHLFSWVLSVETAKRHFPQTVLFTDDEGARILVDTIGLEFDSVFTELNTLHRYDPEWWAVGKIFTYLLQTEPFVHIDSDVFLWKPLPERMERAPLLAQNPESFEPFSSWYYPQKFDLLERLQGWIPQEIEWYKSLVRGQRAVCCGVFGGNRLDFIGHYAQQALDILLHPANQPVWTLLGGDNILIEQYVLSACIEYHKGRASSPFSDIRVEFLFDSAEAAFNPASSTQAGYTHLIGGAKNNKYSLDRLERRVQKDYPQYYERCVRFFEAEIRR